LLPQVVVVSSLRVVVVTSRVVAVGRVVVVGTVVLVVADVVGTVTVVGVVGSGTVPGDVEVLVVEGRVVVTRDGLVVWGDGSDAGFEVVDVNGGGMGTPIGPIPGPGVVKRPELVIPEVAKRPMKSSMLASVGSAPVVAGPPSLETSAERTCGDSGDGASTKRSTPA
jgi:hypothetical protein